MSGKVFLLAGLGFGDEGKGTIVEALTHRHKAHTIVRYNGGAQTSHHVVRPDGTVHAFHQFGSGTFEGAHTHLSRFHLFDPVALAAEAKELAAKGQADALDRLTVDSEAPLVTLYHVMANQIKESARAQRHGSCGMGIWETQRLAVEHPTVTPRAGHLLVRRDLIERLEWVQRRLIAEVQDLPMVPPRKLSALHTSPVVIADELLSHCLGRCLVRRDYLSVVMRREGVTIFEGAQGALLDQDHGFMPHVTGTTTLYDNAHTLLTEAGFSGERQHIGVLRTYMTRHGAGPMPTEHIAAARQIPEVHNGAGEYQGAFRTGALDLVLLRYALRCLGCVDSLAITHADREIDYLCDLYYDQSEFLPSKQATYAEWLTKVVSGAHPCLEPANGRGLECIAEKLEVPIGIVSRGPRLDDKEFLR